LLAFKRLNAPVPVNPYYSAKRRVQPDEQPELF